jgi:glucosylceramidase
MRSLFDPRGGLGLSYLRQPMGASDFVAGPHYTYDDVPAGQTDLRLKHFSIAHDRAEILPLLRQALRLNPRLKVMATPWSPPAWMKTNDSLVGGRFKDDPRVYDAYARYFVRFVQEYWRAGVPIDAVTLQNEPQNRNPSAYPGMDLRDDEEARLVVAVGRAFQHARIHTKILGYDHNWSLHPNDVGPADDPANPEYAASLLSGPAARHYLAGTAFHCYFGDPERQSVLHDAFPQKDIYFTECSGSLSGDPATTFPDTLHWHTRFLTVGAIRNWAKTVITWNLALDPAGGPHNGGCDTCFGVVTIDPATGHATPTADYYVLGHVTRFIRPGAVRIDSTVAGNAWNVAFRNPDGSVVLVVVNDDWGTTTQHFNVVGDGQSFSYALPAGAVATFVLPRGS